MVAYSFRPPSGFAGVVTHIDSATIFPGMYNQTTPPGAFGLAVMEDVNGWRTPLTTGDTADMITGIAMRVYPTSGNGTDGLGVATPNKAQIGSILRRGSMLVKLQNSTDAAAGGLVYVRVASSSSTLFFGGFEAADDTSNTVTLPATCTFSGPKDADGLVEINFNI